MPRETIANLKANIEHLKGLLDMRDTEINVLKADTDDLANRNKIYGAKSRNATSRSATCGKTTSACRWTWKSWMIG